MLARNARRGHVVPIPLQTQRLSRPSPPFPAAAALDELLELVEIETASPGWAGL